MRLILFADSNVFIEALLLPQSAAFVVAEMVAQGAFDIATCQLCVEDAEDAILAKLQKRPNESDRVIESWARFKTDTRLIIHADPDFDLVQQTCDKYLGVMRHKADIPVLASALSMNPPPHAILSGNREHFNDRVAERCGIKICSCQEFIEWISQSPAGP